ncbi:MAG: hypothetical protein WBD24_07275 [Candidatus Omnitrophota bacterium]
MSNEKFFKYCFGCPESHISGTVIVTPFFYLDSFDKFSDIASTFKGKVYSGGTLYRDGKYVTVVRCGIGDRLMGDAVLLMKETPASKIIFIGTCGGLKDREIGDLVLCESAFSGEGFSQYHIQNSGMDTVFDTGQMSYADDEYVGKMKEFVLGRGDEEINLNSGSIFTIGSLLAENRENLMQIEGKGFIGIDLELSAVYSAARAIGRKAAGLLFVSDLPLKKPLGEELIPGEKKAYSDGMDKVIRYSVGFAEEEERE